MLVVNRNKIIETVEMDNLTLPKRAIQAPR